MRINRPGNTATFRAGIGLSTWQVHPFEGTRLAFTWSKRKVALLKTDSHLATHMNDRRAHVVIINVSHDLLTRKHQ